MQIANSTPTCDAANKNKIPSENGATGSGSSSSWMSTCLMGCDLNQYFKEPIDTDGLTAHHNEVNMAKNWSNFLKKRSLNSVMRIDVICAYQPRPIAHQNSCKPFS